MQMTVEVYQVPTLALLTALVAVFVALSLRGRSQTAQRRAPATAPSISRRHLLWLAGWVLAVVRLALQVWGADRSPVGLAISVSCMELTPLMFLGSMAPQYYSRKPPVLYVAAFAAPVVFFAALSSLDPLPGNWGQFALFACVLADLYLAGRWSLDRNLVPIWMSMLIVGAFGGGSVWLMVHGDYAGVLMLAHSGILVMTALLFGGAFPRLTAGVVFTVGGMAVWASVPIAQLIIGAGPLPLTMLRVLNLVKVITAVGMIVLVLEDEVALNLASQQRDRRARLEMEKYTSLYLSDMPVDEESGLYNRVCETIADVSRFFQAAIFMDSAEGGYRLVGRAGMDGALEGALDGLARRTTESRTLEIAQGNYFKPVAGNLTLMDLRPLMEPGDELAQMNFSQAYVMGIRTREGRLQGVLLLSGLRNPEEPIVTEDILPLELLAARLGAAREHLILLRRLMQSERLAGLGQLAGGVAHELNNPLTSVTGFAQLLAESDGVVRQHAEVILNEARRMKLIIDSLMRFRHAAPAGRGPVVLHTLLEDIRKLTRHDLERAHIQLQFRIPKPLPKVKVDGEQILQVFLQVIRNAIESMERLPEGQDRSLIIEAAEIPRGVELMVTNTGPRFEEPRRAFDPYFTRRHPGEGMGLGLSICYAIVRENGGDISAVNLDPRGAAVVIELPVWDEAGEASARSGERHSPFLRGESFPES